MTERRFNKEKGKKNKIVLVWNRNTRLWRMPSSLCKHETENDGIEIPYQLKRQTSRKNTLAVTLYLSTMTELLSFSSFYADCTAQKKKKKQRVMFVRKSLFFFFLLTVSAQLLCYDALYGTNTIGVEPVLREACGTIKLGDDAFPFVGGKKLCGDDMEAEGKMLLVLPLM